MTNRRRAWIGWIAFFCGLSFGGLAGAAEPSVSAQPVSYDAEFFAKNAPQTAFDMVQLLPGFTLEEGAQVRGFADATGNVLIDGQRPSTKVDTLRDTLTRIPASSVLRIEIIRGSVPGIEMQGHAVLANVVRRSKAVTELATTAEFARYGDSRIGGSFRVDAARRDGQSGLEGSVLVFHHENPRSGTGSRVLVTPAGETVSAAKTNLPEPTNALEARATYQHPLWAGLVRLKGSLTIGNDKLREDDKIFAGTVGPGENLRSSEFRTRQREMSADYARNVTAKGELTLLALYNDEHAQDIGFAHQDGIDESTKADSIQREKIGRATFKYRAADFVTLESGGEYAFNALDGHEFLAIDGVPIMLPSSAVLVKERRGEGFSTMTWTLSRRLTVEDGVRVEKSTIIENGDQHKVRSFFFVKPRVLLSWSPFEQDQLRVRAERSASQLDFNDFATVTSFDTGNVTAGNPDLRPETDWTFEAVYEHRFWRDAAAVLTFSHALLNHVIDDVPVEGFSAPGNIGAGRRDTLGLDVTLPLDRLGLPDSQLKTSGLWKFSTVTDPTTHQRRAVSLDQPFTGTLLFTKDLPTLKSSFQVNATLGYAQPTFLIDEIQHDHYATELGLQWTYAPESNFSIDLQLQNFTARKRLRTRFIFGGLRSLDQLDSIETLSIVNGPRLLIDVRKSF